MPRFLAILVSNRKTRFFTVCGLWLSRQNISSHTVSRLDLPTLQYTAETFYERIYKRDYQLIKYNRTEYKIKLNYEFASPETVTVYEEYLIYDTVGMIGSVGGTLGMCIGFSFSTTISNILSFLQRKLRP